jgi:hypothetical protein
MMQFNRFYNDYLNIDESRMIKSMSTSQLDYNLQRNYTLYFTRAKEKTSPDTTIDMIYESDITQGPYFWFAFPKVDMKYFAAAANGNMEHLNQIKNYFGVLWHEGILDIITIFNQNDFFRDFMEVNEPLQHNKLTQLTLFDI